MNSSKLLKRILIFAAAFLLIPALIVVAVDPFFHYHKPLGPLKAVLTEKEYQCVGSLRNLDYDAVIAGSSVSENFNNHWFDEAFDCTSIKAIRSYGATADLCFLLEEAFSSGNDIRYVFYNLDPSAFMSDSKTTFEQTGCPMYLYDHNPFNDVKYLWNKDVLFERVPYMLAKSLMEDYDEGLSYNWAQWKEFNLDMCTGMYLRHPKILPMKEAESCKETALTNIAMIELQVKMHPETTFYIYMPPYSMLWWDNAYREGDTDSYIYATEQCMKTLIPYENVRFYYFMDDEDVILDLEHNYMDTLHFSPDINRYICDCLSSEDDVHRVREDDIAERISHMDELAGRITDSLMDPYVPLIREEVE